MKKILILLGCTTLLLTGCGAQTIDATQFIEVAIDGINGNATATADFDYVALEEFILPEDSDADDIANVLALESSIELEVDHSQHLSNGDVITVQLTWDKDAAKECGINLQGNTKTIEISDLAEATVIDVFECIDVVYSGISPLANARVDIISAPSDLSVYYTLSADSNLKNGDIITVTAEANWDLLEEQGYIVQAKQKDFTVSAPEEYITQYQQFDESTLSTVDDFAKAEIILALETSYLYEIKMYPNEFFTFTGPEDAEIVSIEQAFAYFAFCTDSDAFNGGAQNMLCMVYQVTCKDSFNPEGKTAYIPVRLSNFIIQEDGTITVNEDTFCFFSSYDSEEEAKSALPASLGDAFEYELIDF